MTRPRLVRLLEILPGAATWTALLTPFVGAFLFPNAVAIFILVFDIYWIYKALVMTWHLIQGYRRLERDQRTNFLSKIKENVWQDIYHAVILTTFREPLEVLIPSIESALDSAYPVNRMIFVLATEERDKTNALVNAKILQSRFGKKFHFFLTTEHPDGIPGELKAKGANLNWAARRLAEYIKTVGLRPEQVIVTAADADTRFHRQFFAAVTYAFLNASDKHRRSYQPIPLFSNNLWRANAVSRLLAFGSTFWQLIESTRPWRLINFSTHSASLKMLIDMDYWDVAVVNEDSRQFWRGWFAFGGNHKVVPIFVPVYMDAVVLPSFLQTVKNQYLQRLRWAYGIEHFPYVVSQSFKHKEIPWYNRASYIYRLAEANFSWATASLFIAFAGWVPILLNREFSQTVLAYNLPFITSRLLALSWLGLVVSAWISVKLAPPLPKGMKRHHWLVMALQWVLVPIPAILFGSIPAIEAQTRLMFGRYLGFWTTEKTKVKEI